MTHGRQRDSSTSEVDRLTTVYREYRAARAERWSQNNPGNVSMLAERYRLLEVLLQRAGFWPLAGRRVLDVGCGDGQLLGHLSRCGADAAQLSGVDLLPERIQAATRNFPQIAFTVGNAENLEFDTAAFDLVILSTVFSSILAKDMQRNIASEVSRVSNGTGKIVIYDFRIPSPSNRNVRAVTRRRVAELFPTHQLTAQSLTVLPPLARRLGRRTDWWYPKLGRLPFLRTHNLILLSRATANLKPGPVNG